MEFVDPPEHAVQVMLDLETLGTKPYCPVLTIGAVRFEVGDMQPMHPFYQAIRLESCLEHGLKPAAGTIDWWMKQSQAAQDAAFRDEKAVDLPEALDRFTDWMGSRPDYVWGNSALFDNGILEAAYFACGKQLPWKAFHERCYRTLKSLPGMEQFKLQRAGTHHNALDDAVTQARHCRAMLQHLEKINTPRTTVAPLVAAVVDTVVAITSAGEDSFKDVPLER